MYPVLVLRALYIILYNEYIYIEIVSIIEIMIYKILT